MTERLRSAEAIGQALVRKLPWTNVKAKDLEALVADAIRARDAEILRLVGRTTGGGGGVYSGGRAMTERLRSAEEVARALDIAPSDDAEEEAIDAIRARDAEILRLVEGMRSNVEHDEDCYGPSIDDCRCSAERELDALSAVAKLLSAEAPMVQPVDEETMALARRAAIAQENDTRTDEEKIEDGVAFILAEAPRKHVDIVFDGPPGPVAGRFVEVEDADGHGIRIGEWLQRGDGYWVLRIPDPRVAEAPRKVRLPAAHETNLPDTIERWYDAVEVHAALWKAGVEWEQNDDVRRR